MAKAKAKSATPAQKTSVGRIAGGVVTTSAVLALPFLQANSTIDWSMVQLVGIGQEYRTTVVPKPGLGNFSAKQVEIETGGQPIRIGEVRFEAPTLWMLAATYTRSKLRPSLDHVKVSYSDIKNPDGYSLNSSELPVGPRSGAFAETEGCGTIARISDAQIQELGLSPGPTSITYEIDVDANQITTTETLSTPGLGSARFTRVGTGNRPGKTLFEDYGMPADVMWKSHRWSFTDEGFIKARNEFCARESGVSVDTFLANHVASIERVMAALGVTVSAEMRAMYIDYAANGGTLAMTGDFANEIPEANYSNIPWDKQLLSLRGELQRDGQRIFAGFTSQRERPFSESDYDLTTYQVLLKEGYTVDPLSIPEPGSLLASTTTGKSAASVSAENKINNETASETMVVSVKVEPYTSSQVLGIELDEAEYVTSFEQLGQLVGRKVRIERRNRPVMVAKVLGRTSLGVRLRMNQGGGFAEIEMPKGDFVRARLYPVR
jgi:hypothetical protein